MFTWLFLIVFIYPCEKKSYENKTKPVVNEINHDQCVDHGGGLNKQMPLPTPFSNRLC